MKVPVAFGAVVLAGFLSIGVSAHAEEGYRGVVKAALRQAKLTKESRTLLAAARDFDRDPSVESLRAFEETMSKLQRSLDKTRGSIASLQKSLNSGEEQDEAVEAKAFIPSMPNATRPSKPKAGPGSPPSFPTVVPPVATAKPKTPRYDDGGNFL
jgi:hypothetical protein